MNIRPEFQGVKVNRLHSPVISWITSQAPDARLWLASELSALSAWAGQALDQAQAHEPNGIASQFMVELGRLAEQEIDAHPHLEVQILRSVGFAAQLSAHVELALYPHPELEKDMPQMAVKRRQFMRDDWALFAVELSAQLRHWRHARVDYQ